MGKAVSHASHNIGKSDKKHVNSLSKILRPKVFIIDSSSFKKLVQELTGNGSEPLVSFTPPPKAEPKNSVEFSMSSSESGDQMLSSFDDFTGFQSSWEPMNSYGLPETSMEYLSVSSSESSDQMLSSLPDFTGLQSLWGSMSSDSLPCQEFDPWISEINPSMICSNYSSQPSVTSVYDEGISVYDYDYSGIFSGL